MPRKTNPLEGYTQVPGDFWESVENRHAFLRWFGTRQGYRKPEDWYSCNKQMLIDAGGRGRLLRQSFLELLRELRPDYDWKPWLFQHSQVTPNFWDKSENRREYLEWLGGVVGFEEPEDWYALTTEDFMRNRGRAVWAKFDRSLVNVTTFLYPEREWLEWRFYFVPDGFWEHPASRRRYLEWLGGELGYESLDDYHRLQSQDLIDNYASTLCRIYHGNIIRILAEAFPEHEWHEWRLSKSGFDFWLDSDNCRRYLEWLAGRLGWTTMDDWYKLKASHMNANKGMGILNHFNGSPIAALKAAFPDHEWLEWRFRRVQAGFWDNEQACRRYLDWLADQLGFEELEDWYRINVDDFARHHGIGLINRFNNSIWDFLNYFWPEHGWREWLLARAPSNFWRRRENQRRYLDWLAERLGVRTYEDWYHVHGEDFSKNSGNGLLTLRDGSPSAVLMGAFPEYDWKEWLFDIPPQRFWSQSENRLRYLDWLAERLGYRRIEDWYDVTGRHFRENNGRGALRRYNSSVVTLLKDNFPDYDWQEWFFKVTPSGFWRGPENRRRYLAWLGRELGFESPSDWCRLRNHHLAKSCGKTLLNTFGNVDKVLSHSFPEDHPILQARLRRA